MTNPMSDTMDDRDDEMDVFESYYWTAIDEQWRKIVARGLVAE